MQKSELNNKLRSEWYNNLDVLREILPALWKRDFSFINIENQKASRFYSVNNPYYLIQINDKGTVKYHENNKFNLYRSVATYKQIPPFTYKPFLRTQATRRWLKSESFDMGEYFESYDILFDFDVKDPDKKEQYLILKNEIMEFLEYLNDWVIPYQIIFSGKKGFQITIPYQYLPNRNLSFSIIDRNNFFNYCKKVVENIEEVFGFQFLDKNQNGVRTRLMKCPYSLSQLDCVVLPLAENQIKHFKEPSDFHIKKVMEDINIRKRGLLERFPDISIEDKKKNTKKFMKQFGGKIKW